MTGARREASLSPSWARSFAEGTTKQNNNRLRWRGVCVWGARGEGGGGNSRHRRAVTLDVNAGFTIKWRFEATCHFVGRFQRDEVAGEARGRRGGEGAAGGRQGAAKGGRPLERSGG